MISYSQSSLLFKFLGGHMETDSQFAKWLYKHFGQGTYVIMAWRKGYKGMWCFMKLEINSEGYRRLPKVPSKEEIQLKSEILNTKAQMKRMQMTDDDIERENLKETIENNKEMLDSEKDEKGKKGCYPYLKSLKPVYVFHSYDEYYSEEVVKDEEINMRTF